MKFSTIAAAALLGMASVAGHATPISSASPTTSFSWSYDTGSSLLTGNGSITISGWNSNLLNLLVTLTNTSQVGGQGGERLTAFAFGIDPNATSVSFSDGADGGMTSASWAMGALPANVLGVEVCAFGGQNCAGGGNGGIFAGTSDTFNVRLGGTWGDLVNVSPIGLRYQTGYGSFTFRGDTPRTTPVSEPGAALLVLMGLGLVGFVLRGRATASRAVAVAA